MKLFTLENSRPIITPEALTIQAFKNIWDRDTSTTKEVAVEELAYVYFMEHFDSMFNRYDKATKESIVANNTISKKRLKKFDPKDSLIEEARLTYIELQNTVALDVYFSFLEGMKRIKTATDNMTFDDDGNGKVMKQFFDNITAFGKASIELEKIKEQVIKEQASKVKVKGDREVSRRERHPKDQ